MQQLTTKVPSHEGQKRIAAEADELTAFSVELEACLKQEVATKARILKSLAASSGDGGLAKLYKTR